jgi:hypothetical protein
MNRERAIGSPPNDTGKPDGKMFPNNTAEIPG